MLPNIRMLWISAALVLGLTACNTPNTASPGPAVDKATTTEVAGGSSTGVTAPVVTTVPSDKAAPTGAAAPAPVLAPPPPEAAKVIDAPAPRTTLPAGTELEVILNDSVSTKDSKPGDVFSGSLADPVVIGGKTVLQKGAAVRGRVVEVLEPGRVKGRASLHLALTSVTANGKVIPIKTKTYVGVAKDSKSRDTKIIGGGAAVGAVVGAVAGGAKGAAEGAAIGAGAGTGTVLATKGEELRYPAETRLSFALANSVSI